VAAAVRPPPSPWTLGGFLVKAFCCPPRVSYLRSPILTRIHCVYHAGAPAASGGDAAAPAAKKVEEKEASEEEDMDFGLFD
jgi:hypothetical protein